MKKFFLLLCLISCLECSSQNYLPIDFQNAKFHWNEYSGALGCEIERYHIFDNDTIIGGQTYTQLKFYWYSSNPLWCFSPELGTYHVFMRNDSVNRKVYISYNNQDSLNYDFNDVIGDTLKGYVDGKNYNTFILASIDSIFTNNQWYKRFNYEHTAAFQTYPITLVEGIGLFSFLAFEYGSQLGCYSINNNYIYLDENGPCDPPPMIWLALDDLKKEGIKIETGSGVRVSGFSGTLELFTVQGQRLASLRVKDQAWISDPGLVPGIYLLKLSNGNQRFVKKIFLH